MNFFSVNEEFEKTPAKDTQQQQQGSRSNHNVNGGASSGLTLMGLVGASPTPSSSTPPAGREHQNNAAVYTTGLTQYGYEGFNQQRGGEGKAATGEVGGVMPTSPPNRHPSLSSSSFLMSMPSVSPIGRQQQPLPQPQRHHDNGFAPNTNANTNNGGLTVGGGGGSRLTQSSSSASNSPPPHFTTSVSRPSVLPSYNPLSQVFSQQQQQSQNNGGYNNTRNAAADTDMFLPSLNQEAERGHTVSSLGVHHHSAQQHEFAHSGTNGKHHTHHGASISQQQHSNQQGLTARGCGASSTAAPAAAEAPPPSVHPRDLPFMKYLGTTTSNFIAMSNNTSHRIGGGGGDARSGGVGGGVGGSSMIPSDNSNNNTSITIATSATATAVPFYKQLEAQQFQHKLRQAGIGSQPGGPVTVHGGLLQHHQSYDDITTASSQRDIVNRNNVDHTGGTHNHNNHHQSHNQYINGDQQYAPHLADNRQASLPHTAFTQQFVPVAPIPSDLQAYLQSVRDGSYDLKQKQMHDIQRVYGVAAIAALAAASGGPMDGGGGGGASSSSSALMTPSQQQQMQQRHAANGIAYAVSSPATEDGAGLPFGGLVGGLQPLSANKALSTQEVLRRQQELMEKKKAANVQRWLNYGATNIPQAVLEHHKDRLEELRREEEEAKQRRAAQKQLSQEEQDKIFLHQNTAAAATGGGGGGTPSFLKGAGFGGNQRDESSATTNTNPTTTTAAASAPPAPLYLQMQQMEQNAMSAQFEQKLSKMGKKQSSNEDGGGGGGGRGGGWGRGAWGRGGGRGRLSGAKTVRDPANDETQDDTQQQSGGDSQQTPNAPNASSTASKGGARGRGRGGKNSGGGGNGPSTADQQLAIAMLNRPPTYQPTVHRTLLQFGGGGAANAADGDSSGGGALRGLPPVEQSIWDPARHSGASVAGDSHNGSNPNIPPALAKLLYFIKTDSEDENQLVTPVVYAVAEINLMGNQQQQFQQQQQQQPGTMLLNSNGTVTENSFTLCEKYDGKLLFTPSDSPRDAANLLHRLYIYFRNIAFELDQTSAYYLLSQIVEQSYQIEIATFHASTILIPLLSYNGGVFSCNCFNDIRTMAWMLNPSDSAPSFDRLQLRYNFNATSYPISTRNGILQRLPALLDLYQRFYGSLGHSGLLQAYMRQEKMMGLLCSMMRFNGFCVRTDLGDQGRATAEKRMEALRDKAERFVRERTRFFLEEGAGGGGFNIQSTKDLQAVLYAHMGLQKFLHQPNNGALISAKFRTQGGKYSTAEDVLRFLCKYDTDLVPLIMQYRKIAKLNQTYFAGVLAKENLFPYVDEEEAHAQGITAENGAKGSSSSSAATTTALSRSNSSQLLACVHANFNHASTDTGRLSCVDPNIQNLPRVAEGGLTNSGSSRHESPAVGSAPERDGSIICASAADNNNFDSEFDLANESDAQLASAVRSSFVARPGHTLVSIDYEQIELRVLAHLSNDARLLDALGANQPKCTAFIRHSGGGVNPSASSSSSPASPLTVNNSGNSSGFAASSSAKPPQSTSNDIHRQIAAAVFNKPPDQVTSEERSQAKRVVFGTLYGAGANIFSTSELGISAERAAFIQKRFWAAYPRLQTYHAEVISRCKRSKEKEVRTIAGRWRKFPEIESSNPAIRAQMERQAFNTVVQGSAADIVKKAMIHVFTAVIARHYSVDGADGGGDKTHKACGLADRPLLLCQIHDELIFSVPSRSLSAIVPNLKDAMENCHLLNVPLKVSVKFGPSLGELKEWTLEGDLGLFDALS